MYREALTGGQRRRIALTGGTDAEHKADGEILRSCGRPQVPGGADHRTVHVPRIAGTNAPGPLTAPPRRWSNCGQCVAHNSVSIHMDREVCGSTVLGTRKRYACQTEDNSGLSKGAPSSRVADSCFRDRAGKPQYRAAWGLILRTCIASFYTEREQVALSCRSDYDDQRWARQRVIVCDQEWTLVRPAAEPLWFGRQAFWLAPIVKA